MRNWNGAMERFPEVEDVGVDVDMVGARHGELHHGFVVVEEEGAEVLHIIPGGSGLDEFFPLGLADVNADMIPARAATAVGEIFAISGTDDVMRVKLDSLPLLAVRNGKHAPGGTCGGIAGDWVGDSEGVEMGESGFHGTGRKRKWRRCDCWAVKLVKNRFTVA